MMYKYLYIGKQPQNVVVSTYWKKQLLETGTVFESDIHPRYMRAWGVYAYNDETVQQMKDRISQYEATIDMKKESEKHGLTQLKTEYEARIEDIKKETIEQIEHYNHRMESEKLYIASVEKDKKTKATKETKETKESKK